MGSRSHPYRRAERDAVVAEIRAISNAHTTYDYRRVTALLNRAGRSSGEPRINHKRIFRLMRLASMLLQLHTGSRSAARRNGDRGSVFKGPRTHPMHISNLVLQRRPVGKGHSA